MSNHIPSKAIMTILAVLMLSWLTGCAASPQSSVDPAAIEVAVSTNPSPVGVNAEVKLLGIFSGIKLDESATVSFEIRNGDQLEFVDAAFVGDNTFESTYTFKNSGINEVFVHLYSGDLHITKKKPLEVQ